jgi:hypothetical protein
MKVVETGLLCMLTATVMFWPVWVSRDNCKIAVETKNGPEIEHIKAWCK